MVRRPSHRRGFYSSFYETQRKIIREWNYCYQRQLRVYGRNRLDQTEII